MPSPVSAHISTRASTLNTIALTVAAMLAFAANSLLCRLALQRAASIQPAFPASGWWREH